MRIYSELTGKEIKQVIWCLAESGDKAALQVLRPAAGTWVSNRECTIYSIYPKL